MSSVEGVKCDECERFVESDDPLVGWLEIVVGGDTANQYDLCSWQCARVYAEKREAVGGAV